MNGVPQTLWFRTAGVVVRLDGCDDQLADIVLGAGSGMVGDPQAQASVRLVIDHSGGVSRLGREVLDDDPLRGAATVLAAVDRASLAASSALCIHAAAVAGPRGAVILPGASGSGKTTLTGACLQAGLSLLSDEAACLTEELQLAAHRRPLGLSRHSRVLLGLDSLEDTEDELATSPSLLETTPLLRPTAPVVLVALLDRRAGAGANLSPASRMDVLSQLMANRLDFATPPRWSAEQAWSLLSRLASHVEAARLTFDSPHDAAQVLVNHLEEHTGNPPS